LQDNKAEKIMYYLISTINPECGWNIFGIGSKEEMYKRAESLWLSEDKRDFSSNDIYSDTLYKNYKVLCKTKVSKFINLEKYFDCLDKEDYDEIYAEI
jgi:hypothetical protein